MDFHEKAVNLVSQMTYAEKLSQLLYTAPAIPRLGIPEYNWWNEALHGYARSGTATVFPQAIGLAASFNEEDMYKTACIISEEARAKYNGYRKKGSTTACEGLTLWSPNINIFRDPRWGRGHETYGEDPYLTARMGTAFVSGIQQEDDQGHRKADATLKHYAVHSGPESKRHVIDVQIGEKDLYETYLYAFRYIIQHAHPAAVMGAYNRVNGLPCCGSPVLLEQILREEFGFKGYVVSDCGAICDFHLYHKITRNEAESSAMAVNAGCDLNCGDAYAHLQVACAAGMVNEETITKACVRLFETRYRLGMNEKTGFDNIEYRTICSNDHLDMSRKMSRQAFVLLKNDGILPFKRGQYKKIAIIGPNADEKEVLLGNYNGIPDRYQTILRGVQEKLGKGRDILYATGSHLYKEQYSWVGNPFDEAVLTAQESDLVILCVGLAPQLEGEEGDAYNSAFGGDKATLSIPDIQVKLYEALKETKKPIIVCNISGSAVNLLFAEKANAIIQGFYPGQYGGTAFAELLLGEYDPSARLPVTFYKSDDDLKPFEDYSMDGRTYRYFDKEVLYPFGFGLSYTKFIYSDFRITKGKAKCKIKNIGKRNGYAVPQVYVAFPEDEDAPIKRLVGFSKRFIKSKEELIIEFPLAEDALFVFDQNGKQRKAKGKAVFYLSESSDLKNGLVLNRKK